jgi:hypothetical protein
MSPEGATQVTAIVGVGLLSAMTWHRMERNVEDERGTVQKEVRAMRLRVPSRIPNGRHSLNTSLFDAPKGQNKIAQGNALGTWSMRDKP